MEELHQTLSTPAWTWKKLRGTLARSRTQCWGICLQMVRAARGRQHSRQGKSRSLPAGQACGITSSHHRRAEAAPAALPLPSCRLGAGTEAAASPAPSRRRVVHHRRVLEARAEQSPSGAKLPHQPHLLYLPKSLCQAVQLHKGRHPVCNWVQMRV